MPTLQELKNDPVLMRMLRNGNLNSQTLCRFVSALIDELEVKKPQEALGPVYARNTNYNAFRPGEWAVITGLYTITPPGMVARHCYELTYADGKVDYSALNDPNNTIEIQEL